MKKYNEILYEFTAYIKELKLELNGVNKDNIVLFIKRRRYLIGNALIIIFIVLVTFISSFVTNKHKLLNNLEISMKKGESRHIEGHVFLEDEKLSKDQLNPLVQYYNVNGTRIDKVLSELKNSNVSGVFSIRSKKSFLWNNYYLEVDTVGAKINCNFENAKIFIDNKEVIGGNIKRGLVPGLHKIKAQINSDYGNIEKEIEVSLMQNEEFSVKIDAIDFNITSNFNDASVFVNDKDINKKVNESQNYGPIPSNESIEVYLQRRFPWGIIRSEKVKVNDSPNINLDINMVNEKLITEIQLSIESFYESVFNALNKKDYKLIVLTDEEIQKKIYDEISVKSFIFKNNYEISDLEIKIENSEFKYENNIYKAQMVVEIDYAINKKLLFSYFKKKDMILTNMELVGDKWMVKEIQKIIFE